MALYELKELNPFAGRHFLLYGEEAWRLKASTQYSPPMVEHRLCRGARPTSLLWLMLTLDVNGAMPKTIDTVIVPTNRKWIDCLAAFKAGEGFDRVDVEDYHAEVTGGERGLGRPSVLEQYPFALLRDSRERVWTGQVTIRDLAKELKVSERCAHSFAHGDILWWV